MSQIILKNGTVVTLGDNNQVLQDHFVSIRDDVIEKVAHNKELADFKIDSDATIINASQKLVMPGFINAHMHYYSSFARGLNKAAPSNNFTEILNNLWWRLDKKLTLDDCYFSALVANIEAIKKGTTTIIDHHASVNAVKGSLDKIAQAVKQSGLRACLCYEVSDRDGEAIAKQGIAENTEFIQSINESNSDQLKALFGLHASFTISDETLKQAVLAAKNCQAFFHIHTAEDLADQEITLEKTGKRVVERLYSAGVLGDKTICVHGVHLNDSEIDLLKTTDTMVVCNPQSNMNNAVGISDIVKMTEKGLLVGLGTDAMTVNMLEELRFAIWSQKLKYNHPGVGFMECINALINNNAKIVRRLWDEKIGELKEGFKADVILMDYSPPTPLDSQTFAGHLVFGVSQASVDTTIANGKILMQNKKLQDLDERQIHDQALELAQRLWSEF